MNLDEIRNMSDEDLRRFMNDISQRNNTFCSRCGNVVSVQEKRNVNISVYDKNAYGQKARKLCSLCMNCYVDMLDYLGVSDIDWKN